jgi:hypothetical protein
MVTRERILRIAQELEDGGEGGIARGLRALAPRFPTTADLVRMGVVKAVAPYTPLMDRRLNINIVC